MPSTTGPVAQDHLLLSSIWDWVVGCIRLLSARVEEKPLNALYLHRSVGRRYVWFLWKPVTILISAAAHARAHNHLLDRWCRLLFHRVQWTLMYHSARDFLLRFPHGQYSQTHTEQLPLWERGMAGVSSRINLQACRAQLSMPR